MKKIMALLLAGAMAFSAVGCGAGEDDMAEASTELNIYMWQNYISDDLITAFEKENNCTVNLSYMDSTAESVEKLTTGCGDEYDLVMVQNVDMEFLVEGDYLEKIKPDSLPNTSNIRENCWVSKNYGIPYLMNYVYVVYDSETCPIEIKGYGDLLNPALKGKISSVDGARNLMSMALVALGYDPNSKEEAELEKAYEWLRRFHENVAVYDTDGQALIDGEVSVAVTYDRNAAKAMAKKDTIQIAPFEKHKIQVVVDMFVIPKGAQHMDLAETFMNYICDPEVMAANLEEVPYSCPNDVAEVLASEAYHQAPERNFEYKDNVFLHRSIGDAADLYDEYYQKLKTGE